MSGRRARPAVLAALVLAALTGCTSVASGTDPTTGPPPTARESTSLRPTSSADAHSAGAVLATLSVKGRAPKTGYARSQFGEAWTDSSGAVWSGNGLSTREDVLSRDLTSVTCKTRPPERAAPHCVVSSGVLHDPYTGRTIHFVRGVRTSQAVQIEHVVALSDAWQTGAQRLTRAERIDLANDPLELLAVDGPTNSAKGDGDAATWLPPNKSFRCAYVARQVAVKARYHLWVTAAEKDAIARVLSRCPDQPLPATTDAERRSY
jgi:uncharacterized protein YceK